MVSFSKPTGSFELETTVRLLLLLNNSVALALSFATLRALFIVVGSIFAVSILFNFFVLLAKVRSRRLSLKTDDEKQCPSRFVLGIDILGVLAFLSLYVCSTIETATRDTWDWAPKLLMAYASIGTLVAFAMHGYLSLKNAQKYIRYRQTVTSRCPHCHEELGFVPTRIALPPSPIVQAEASTGPRESFSANASGENEGDMLILKS
ncbi:hypothetical protein H2200_000463 [Cladophialophora chaetospira]|uniref:Uncharacterized protein n=1 Tax=Cladophialophora chaetospira TaxID=386627 RepID=A0AA38XNK8_9EURO|nr:hypothetical protein H2200_000463 [Cladophialophora chaetospira]